MLLMMVYIDFVLCHHVAAAKTKDDRKTSRSNMLIVHQTLMNAHSTDSVIDCSARMMATVYHDNLIEYWFFEQREKMVVMMSEPDGMILNNHVYDDDDNDWMDYGVMKQVENLMMYVLSDSYIYYLMDFSNHNHFRNHNHAKNVD